MAGEKSVTRRLMIIQGAVIVLFLLAACGSSPDSDSDSRGEVAEVPAPTADADNDANANENSAVTAMNDEEAASGPMLQFYIDNKITNNSVPACTSVTSSVTIFNPNPVDVPSGLKSGPYSLDLSAMAGLGVQVNFWYWSQKPNNPVGKDSDGKQGDNNPDNSGAQYHLAAPCSITSCEPPWYGIGVETYRIAKVTAALQNGECVITIEANANTGCVTPSCCDYEQSPCKDVLPRTTECGHLPPPAPTPPC